MRKPGKRAGKEKIAGVHFNFKCPKIVKATSRGEICLLAERNDREQLEIMRTKYVFV